MADFNLADVLRETSAQDLGQAGREQIQYIDIDLIDPDPKNFYELSDLDELAANIELVGLQQPLRVRKHPENPDRWMIVSGHRRRAAIRQLVDEGKDQLRAVACIVEQPAASEALQELRLIFANSGTRKLTPAEISKQAERVEMLLYELKEQGMEFPGRMRDHVAEACKVSKSKLSRLKVIRDKLIPELQELFKKDRICEDAAYTAARETEQIQRFILAVGEAGNYLSTWTVENAIKVATVNRIDRCQVLTGECVHYEVRMREYARGHWANCSGQCCAGCSFLINCNMSCSRCDNKRAALLAARKEQEEIKREERAAQSAQLKEEQARKRKEMEALDSLHWKRVGERRKTLGMSFDEVYNGILGLDLDEDEYETAEKQESGEEPDDVLLMDSPLEYADNYDLLAIANKLQCSIDYLLGRSETPQPPTATLESAEAWLPYEMADDMLEEGDEALVLHRMTPGGPLLARIGIFRGHVFREREYGMPISGTVAWQPYHDPELNVPDSGTSEDRRCEN